jgi:HK97 family phage major capsid protein
MNEKLLELLEQINKQKQKVQNLVSEEKLDEAQEAKEELKNLQKKFDLLKDVLDAKKDSIKDSLSGDGENNQTQTVKPAGEDTKPDAVAAFAQAARGGFVNEMSSGSNEDGGYTVPEDIQTRINEYREAKASLIEEVDVEPVTIPKGSRTFKKRSQQTGFTKVGEHGKIPGKNTPQFERIDYEISKYAGYFAVTNELLEDSDESITNTLVRWIADESRVTRNKLILEALQKKEKTALSGLDDIKKVLNVTLGQAFKPTSKIITNDDGLQYLDTLKDGMGRDLLQPNPTEPASLQLRAGATVIPVKVIPNADLASDTATEGETGIPFLIGDLKEAVKFFDRRQVTIKTSDIAAVGDLNAFEEDLTIYRAIEREDVELKDAEAYVYGEIRVTDSEGK